MRCLHAGLLLLGLSGCALTVPADSPRFPVYFEPWSAAIDPAAERNIQAAADLAKQTGLRPVVVAGYADPTGSREANIDMSQTRAQVVADALVDHGVSPGRITKQARGATPVVQDLQESRRVDIIVAK